MLVSVNGTFDGKRVTLDEEVSFSTPQRVIITFLEEDNETSNKVIYSMAESGGAFDFLNDPQEEEYSVADLKVRYK